MDSSFFFGDTLYKHSILVGISVSNRLLALVRLIVDNCSNVQYLYTSPLSKFEIIITILKSIHVGFSLPNCCHVASLRLLS
jgi:hypothetical protein